MSELKLIPENRAIRVAMAMADMSMEKLSGIVGVDQDQLTDVLNREPGHVAAPVVDEIATALDLPPDAVLKATMPGVAICDACGGLGYLCLQEDDIKRMKIQKCDTCDAFENDDEATLYVHALSKAAHMQLRNRTEVGIEYQRFVMTPEDQAKLGCKVGMLPDNCGWESVTKALLGDRETIERYGSAQLLSLSYKKSTAVLRLLVKHGSNQALTFDALEFSDGYTTVTCKAAKLRFIFDDRNHAFHVVDLIDL